MKKILFILGLALIMISCLEKKRLDDARKVHVGMSVYELKEVMGDPWSIELGSNYEYWYYEYWYNGYKKRMNVKVVGDTIISFYSY